MIKAVQLKMYALLNNFLLKTFVTSYCKKITVAKFYIFVLSGNI